jgi:integrator complex subunit 2
VLAQESAIVQQLLEICIMGSDDHEIGVIEQVRVTICGFLHDLFIENPLMIKLVHFQGKFQRISWRID